LAITGSPCSLGYGFEKKLIEHALFNISNKHPLKQPQERQQKGERSVYQTSLTIHHQKNITEIKLFFNPNPV
jgi:hypothetical protein